MIAILGESGSGKTTLQEMLLDFNPKLKRIVSFTTRPPRDGETDGIEYHFVSDSAFQALVNKDFFVEISNYRGWNYGLPKSECENNENGVCVITPHGLRQLKAKGITPISIYLLVNRRLRLMNLLDRGDDIEESYRRNVSDIGQFDGIADEVDAIIENYDLRLNPKMVMTIALSIIHQYQSDSKREMEK